MNRRGGGGDDWKKSENVRYPLPYDLRVAALTPSPPRGWGQGVLWGALNTGFKSPTADVNRPSASRMGRAKKKMAVADNNYQASISAWPRQMAMDFAVSDSATMLLVIRTWVRIFVACSVVHGCEPDRTPDFSLGWRRPFLCIAVTYATAHRQATFLFWLDPNYENTRKTKLFTNRSNVSTKTLHYPSTSRQRFRRWFSNELLVCTKTNTAVKQYGRPPQLVVENTTARFSTLDVLVRAVIFLRLRSLTVMVE